MRVARATGAVLACQAYVHCQTPKTQKVYFWGSSSSIPQTKDCRIPAEAPFFSSHPKRWNAVSFGSSFGAALDESGDIYTWGQKLASDEIGCKEVQRIKCRAQGTFIDVQCSADKIYALTRTGRPWEFVDGIGREMTEIPRIPGWFGSSGTVQMSVGSHHASFLLKNGDVYMIGRNKYGECGTTNPLPIKAQKVHCGGTHTVIIDQDGQPHVLGDDTQIQLGLGDTRGLLEVDERKPIVFSPDGSHESRNPKLQRLVVYKHYERHQQAVPIPCLPPPTGQNRDPYPKTPTLVGLGDNFTVFAHRDSPDNWEEGDTHVLFCCGDNQYGQCGRSFQQHHQTWNKVRTPKYQFIESLSCGSGHCLALMKNEVWGWGRNQCGQAIPRQGSAGYSCSPELANIPGRPVKVSAKFDASCAICEEG